MRKNTAQRKPIYSPLPKRPRQYAQDIIENKITINHIPLEYRSWVKKYLDKVEMNERRLRDIESNNGQL